VRDPHLQYSREGASRDQADGPESSRVRHLNWPVLVNVISHEPDLDLIFLSYIEEAALMLRSLIRKTVRHHRRSTLGRGLGMAR
jgi:hypothetical protein